MAHSAKKTDENSPRTTSMNGDNDDDDSSSRIEIDGSLGEGGGQILRNAISFAALLQTPIRIINIRAGRPKPGLQAQHTTALRLVARLTNGTLTGDTVGSTTVDYTPPKSTLLSPVPNNPVIKGDTQTAGSICLLLQAALPCALLLRESESRLQLKGGTNASMAPQYDYWSMVFLPTLVEQCGLVPANNINHIPASIVPTVLRRGYFPKGGGEVHVVVSPRTNDDGPLRPIRLTDRGDVQKLYIRSFHAGKLPRRVAVDMAVAAEQRLRDSKLLSNDCTIDSEIVAEINTRDSACGILVVATTSTNCRLAGSALGAPRNVKYRAIGQTAAQELIDTWHDGGCVDEWLQDQLILFMALADGASEIVTGSLTLHTQTAIQVAERMTGVEFTVQRVVDDGDGNRNKDDVPPGTNPAAATGNGVAYDEAYGKDGRINGKHSIRCNGMAFRNHSTT